MMGERKVESNECEGRTNDQEKTPVTDGLRGQRFITVRLSKRIEGVKREEGEIKVKK